MPSTPFASLQLGRVARSSQQMPAFNPFADALEARCDGLLLAVNGPGGRSRAGRTTYGCYRPLTDIRGEVARLAGDAAVVTEKQPSADRPNGSTLL